MSKKKDLSGKKKPAKIQPKARVHRDLDGLEVSIDAFGEITSNTRIEKINAFLDKNVEDKKLIEREENEAKKKAKKKS